MKLLAPALIFFSVYLIMGLITAFIVFKKDIKEIFSNDNSEVKISFNDLKIAILYWPIVLPMKYFG